MVREASEVRPEGSRLHKSTAKLCITHGQDHPNVKESFSEFHAVGAFGVVITVDTSACSRRARLQAPSVKVAPALPRRCRLCRSLIGAEPQRQKRK